MILRYEVNALRVSSYLGEDFLVAVIKRQRVDVEVVDVCSVRMGGFWACLTEFFHFNCWKNAQ